MKQRGWLFCLLILPVFTLQAQLNAYKYAVIPKKFDGFREENHYQSSTLIKHLFVQEGFTAHYEDEVTEDFNANRCLGFWVSLSDQSTMFRTSVTLILKDCNNREIFRTQRGDSKKKNMQDAYWQAIREAFESVRSLDYAFVPPADSGPITVSFKNDVKQLGAETETPQESSDSREEAGIQQEASPEIQRYENKQPLSSPKIKDSLSAGSPAALPETPELLFAQPVENGFQLVDRTPSIKLRLYNTSKPGLFLATREGQNGIVYEHNGNWYLEYYDGNELRTETLSIKF